MDVDVRLVMVEGGKPLFTFVRDRAFMKDDLLIG